MSEADRRGVGLCLNVRDTKSSYSPVSESWFPPRARDRGRKQSRRLFIWHDLAELTDTISREAKWIIPCPANLFNSLGPSPPSSIIGSEIPRLASTVPHSIASRQVIAVFVVTPGEFVCERRQMDAMRVFGRCREPSWLENVFSGNSMI